LASVISSGVVAVVTLVVNAMMKRGDRKHTTSLEFDKRVRDAKSAALLALIEKCTVIRRAIRDSEKHGVTYQQAAVYNAFREYYFVPGEPALTAYAAPSVNALIDEFNQLMLQSMSTDALLYVGRIPELRRQIEAAIDQQDFSKAATHRGEEVETMHAMGKLSGIDVAAVNALCDKLIATAQRDLCGQPKHFPSRAARQTD
jgi:hypothetical protein